jgi:hypothetical protein
MAHNAAGMRLRHGQWDVSSLVILVGAEARRTWACASASAYGWP